MRLIFRALVGSLIISAVSLVQAQGFSALISPSRVETAAKPSQTTRQVLEISQVGPVAGRFRVYTNDWKLNAVGGVDFFEDLQPGSCRPWVALEKRELAVQGNSKTRFRFEITPPADAPSAECRFAIMFEGLDTSQVSPGGLSFPVSGRIGVIVYANMPGNKMQLQVVGQAVSKDTIKLPTLQVSNTGTAHGRVTGLLTGTDAKGIKLEFTPTSLPVMPAETRSISLSANQEGGAVVNKINYPVTVKGALEWDGQRVPYEHLFKEE